MSTKVAHIVWGFDIGGIETMLVNIINEQIASGADVSLVIINDIVNRDLIARIDSRVKIIYIGRAVKSRNIWPLVRLNITLWRLKPAVIHCHSHTIGKYMLSRFLKRAVVTIHNTGVVKERETICRFAKIFAISEAVKRELSAFDLESKVIYNGIYITKIESRDGIRTERPMRLVQVGRLVEQKGHRVAIEALKALRELDITLDCIGDGALRNELETMVAEAGLTERVRLLGSQSQEYIFTHLKEYDALLQPSNWEGFGLTAVEAMAAKIPVIASDIDGLAEVLGRGEYGECFATGSAEQCAEAIARLYEKPYTQERLDAIYERANQNFNVKQTAANYLNEYKKL